MGTARHEGDFHVLIDATCRRCDGVALIVGGTGARDIAVFANRGGIGQNSTVPTAWNGFALTPAAFVTLQAPTHVVNDIETGDANGDGLPDVIGATGSAPCVGEQNILLFNTTVAIGTPTLTEVTATNLPQQLEDTEDIEFFDLEGDGDLDIVTGNFDGPNAPPVREGQNYIYTNNGFGVYTTVPPDRARRRIGAQ